MQHLTETQIAGFRRGDLPAHALLEADGHLKQCPECRRKLLDLSAGRDQEALFASVADDHVEYDQLEAYADGRLPEPTRVHVIGHLAVCPECRAEADDLCGLRSQLRPSHRRAFPLKYVAGAIAASLLVLAGTWWLRTPASQIPPSYSRLVSDALLTGRVGISPRIAELRTSAGVLRGEGRADAFRLESPLGTAVVDRTPQFRWQAVAPDARYQVHVFDADLALVLESGSLAGTEWIAGQPLPRGRLYRWQVTALVNGRTLRAPGAAAPEAKFFVLDQPAVDEIEAVRRLNNQLLLGLLYAHAGVLDLAEKQLSDYVAAHPTAEARALLANLLANSR